MRLVRSVLVVAALLPPLHDISPRNGSLAPLDPSHNVPPVVDPSAPLSQRWTGIVAFPILKRWRTSYAAVDSSHGILSTTGLRRTPYTAVEPLGDVLADRQRTRVSGSSFHYFVHLSLQRGKDLYCDHTIRVWPIRCLAHFPTPHHW